MVEVNQHHDARLGGHAGQSDETHRDDDREVVAQNPHPEALVPLILKAVPKAERNGIELR